MRFKVHGIVLDTGDEIVTVIDAPSREKVIATLELKRIAWDSIEAEEQRSTGAPTLDYRTPEVDRPTAADGPTIAHAETLPMATAVDDTPRSNLLAWSFASLVALFFITLIVLCFNGEPPPAVPAPVVPAPVVQSTPSVVDFQAITRELALESERDCLLVGTSRIGPDRTVLVIKNVSNKKTIQLASVVGEGQPLRRVVIKMDGSTDTLFDGGYYTLEPKALVIYALDDATDPHWGIGRALHEAAIETSSGWSKFAVAP